MLASTTSRTRQRGGVPRLPAPSAPSRRAWFRAPAFADLCAVADLRLWRFAITAAGTP